MFERNYTIVDIETTGGKPFFHRVIEIGILRIEKGEVVAKYKSLVNPQAEIPEFITYLTGITEAKVKKAPLFEEIVEDIFPLFEDSVFVAHNCSFDYGFLKGEFKRLGYGFTMDTLCTVRLSRALFPEHKRHNLGELIARYNFKVKNRHRAFDDAKVLWDFFRYLNKHIPPEQLDLAVARTMKKIPPAAQRKLANKPVNELSYVLEEMESAF